MSNQWRIDEDVSIGKQLKTVERTNLKKNDVKDQSSVPVDF